MKARWLLFEMSSVGWDHCSRQSISYFLCWLCWNWEELTLTLSIYGRNVLDESAMEKSDFIFYSFELTDDFILYLFEYFPWNNIWKGSPRLYHKSDWWTHTHKKRLVNPRSFLRSKATHKLNSEYPSMSNKVVREQVYDCFDSSTLLIETLLSLI